MNRSYHFLAKFMIVLLVTGCGSPPPSPTPGAHLSQKIDAFMMALVAQNQFSGALLVAREGKVLLSKGYGLANIELTVPNTPQTKFRLGSITKQFTALAILQLQQQGKLNVQEPICQYLPACPEAWHSITLHHLLTHTSGIPNFTAAADYPEFKKQLASPLQIMAQFRDLPLDFVPGEQWHYTNSGYIVLGYVIERVSGQPYARFLQDHIFTPLHMTDTGYDDNHQLLMRRAAGYATFTANADYIDMSVPYAAGGLYSTVEDLFRWDQALYTDTVLPLTLRDEMFTPFEPIPVTGRENLSNAEASYGYGWRIDKQFDQLRVAHGGGIDGFATKFDRYPDSQVAIIILSNLENAPVGDFASDIARILFGTK